MASATTTEGLLFGVLGLRVSSSYGSEEGVRSDHPGAVSFGCLFVVIVFAVHCHDLWLVCVSRVRTTKPLALRFCGGVRACCFSLNRDMHPVLCAGNGRLIRRC